MSTRVLLVFVALSLLLPVVGAQTDFPSCTTAVYCQPFLHNNQAWYCVYSPAVQTMEWREGPYCVVPGSNLPGLCQPQVQGGYACVAAPSPSPTPSPSPKPQYCVPSSDVTDIHVRGFVTTDGVTFWDSCKSDRVVVEQTCRDGSRYAFSTECPVGASCVDGACLWLQPIVTPVPTPEPTPIEPVPTPVVSVTPSPAVGYPSPTPTVVSPTAWPTVYPSPSVSTGVSVTPVPSAVASVGPSPSVTPPPTLVGPSAPVLPVASVAASPSVAPYVSPVPSEVPGGSPVDRPNLVTACLEPLVCADASLVDGEFCQSVVSLSCPGVGAVCVKCDVARIKEALVNGRALPSLVAERFNALTAEQRAYLDSLRKANMPERVSLGNASVVDARGVRVRAVDSRSESSVEFDSSSGSDRVRVTLPVVVESVLEVEDESSGLRYKDRVLEFALKDSEGEETGLLVLNTDGLRAQDGVWTGAVERVELRTESESVSVLDAGLVRSRLALRAELERMPAAGGSLDVTTEESLDTTSAARAEAAARVLNLSLSQASVVYRVRTQDLSTTARNATLSFEVDAHWVDSVGGSSRVRVVRVSDSGEVELLSTRFVGANASSGLLRFEADSPRGLSVFALYSVNYLSDVAVDVRVPIVSVVPVVATVVPVGGVSSSPDSGSSSFEYGLTLAAVLAGLLGLGLVWVAVMGLTGSRTDTGSQGGAPPQPPVLPPSV